MAKKAMGENSLSAGKVFLFGALGALTAIFLSLLLLYLNIDISFLDSAVCDKGPEVTHCFFDDEWDSGTYLSTITSFYTTIITLLIAILGTFAFVSLFSLKSSAKQQVEDVLHNVTKDYFESKPFILDIEAAVKKASPIIGGEVLSKIDTIEAILQDNELMSYPKLEVNGEEEA